MTNKANKVKDHPKKKKKEEKILILHSKSHKYFLI